MTAPLNATDADAGILEAIEALNGEQLAELQANSLDAAEALRSMMSCVQRFAEQSSCRDC